jgi:hypothetical protein
MNTPRLRIGFMLCMLAPLAACAPQIQPRRALKEFIPRCLDRGVLLGLSTWFFGSGVERVEAVDGFVRVWDKTLGFLK